MGRICKGFTPAEHDEVAERLKAIEEELRPLTNKIFDAYGVASKASKAIEKLSSSPGVFFKLRNALDLEHGRENRGTEVCSKYFG